MFIYVYKIIYEAYMVHSVVRSLSPSVIIIHLSEWYPLTFLEVWVCQ